MPVFMALFILRFPVVQVQCTVRVPCSPCNYTIYQTVEFMFIISACKLY